MYVLVAVALGAWWWVRASGRGAVHEFEGPTMGAAYVVRVAHVLSETDRERVAEVIAARLERLEGLLSTYDPASEISRFNRHASTEPFPVSAELVEVLALAQEVSDRSGGVLDVTVAPLVEAWGFGAGSGLGAVPPHPSEEELAELRARVGYTRLHIDAAAGALVKSVPDLSIDVSSLGTGYAAEAVANDLRGLGLANFLVDVGGELQASGRAPRGRAWRVGVERPEVGASGVWGSVELGDEGIATSGDYRDFYEEAGVRYAHIVDPRSGMPLPVRGASVTVVHARAPLADAWATALTVLGPEAGMEVARREGLAVMFLERTDQGIAARRSPAMEARPGVREVEE